MASEIFFFSMVLLAISTEASGATVGKVYFADSGAGTILCAGLVPGGSPMQVLVSGLQKPSGVAVHVGLGQIFWTDADARKVQRAKLDGSNVQDLVVLQTGAPAGITLDTINGKMYWADSAIYSHRIQRANLDGSNVEDFVNSDTLRVVHDVAVHPQGFRVYWTDTMTHKIQSADLHGNDIYDHVETSVGSPSAIDLDFVSNKIVWTDTFEDEIRRADFGRYPDGIQSIVTTGLDSPKGLAIDLQGRKIYWTDGFTRKVQRSDLSGQNVETLVASGLSEPSGIAVVPDETTTSTITTSTISSSTRSSSTTTTTTVTSTSTTTSTTTPISSTSTSTSTSTVTTTTWTPQGPDYSRTRIEPVEPVEPVEPDVPESTTENLVTEQLNNPFRAPASTADAFFRPGALLFLFALVMDGVCARFSKTL